MNLLWQMLNTLIRYQKGMQNTRKIPCLRLYKLQTKFPDLIIFPIIVHFICKSLQDSHAPHLFLVVFDPFTIINVQASNFQTGWTYISSSTTRIPQMICNLLKSRMMQFHLPHKAFVTLKLWLPTKWKEAWSLFILCKSCLAWEQRDKAPELWNFNVKLARIGQLRSGSL